MAPLTIANVLTAGVLVLGASAQTTTTTQYPSTFVTSTSSAATVSATHKLSPAQQSAVADANAFAAKAAERAAAAAAAAAAAGEAAGIVDALQPIHHDHRRSSHTAHGTTLHSVYWPYTCTTTVFPSMGPTEQTTTTHSSTIFVRNRCPGGKQACKTETILQGHGLPVKIVATATADVTTMTFPCGDATFTQTEMADFVTATAPLPTILP